MCDALTGASNRRYFERHLGRELKRVHRTGGTLSLMIIDIDHFKQINDQLGHDVGDEVLRQFSHHIGYCLPRESDWYARIGGEEFVVVLPDTTIQGALVVAERTRQFVQDHPVSTTRGLVKFTVSIGLSGTEAFGSNERISAEVIVRSADQCLYESKRDGRNRVSRAPILRKA